MVRSKQKMRVKERNTKLDVVVPQKKIKVLAYCDTPSCATGFGTVSRALLNGLYKTSRYEIEILGINYWGNPHPFPYFKIWPVGTNNLNDPYGRKKVCGMIPKMEFDLLFFLQDTFILNFLPELMQHLKQQGKKFRSICYFPIDGTPKEQWIKNISVVDYPVAYCEFGKKMSQEVYPDCPELGVIPHGVNTKEYFPLPKNDVERLRKEYFGIHADKFIFTNLNRNQQRKDIPRTIIAFKEFKKQVPDSILYCHCAMKDQGWDLPEVCKSFGLNIREDVIFPQNFSPNQGYPREMVNIIYNISDCVISASLGEGMGLSWIEAMAARIPVIMPNDTAMAEFITEDRGYLVKSGTNSSLFTVLPHDNEVIRPLVDVDDMVKVMLHVYNNYDEAKQKAENAYAWVHMQMDWQDHIVPRWVSVFDKAYGDLGCKEEIDDRKKIIGAEEF